MQIVRQTERRLGDETLSRLVSMATSANLTALDKTITAIRNAPNSSYSTAACRTGDIAIRIERAMHELGRTLPAHQRAIK